MKSTIKACFTRPFDLDRNKQTRSWHKIEAMNRHSLFIGAISKLEGCNLPFSLSKPEKKVHLILGLVPWKCFINHSSEIFIAVFICFGL